MPRREMHTEKPKNFKGTVKRMVREFKPDLGLIIFIVILSIASAILSVYSPLLIKDLLSTENLTQMFSIDNLGNIIIVWDIFWQKFGIMLGIYCGSALLSWASAFLAVFVSSHYAYNMRDKLQKKLNTLPLSYFDRVQYGDTLSVATNDVDNISRNMQTIITQVFSGVTLFVGSLIMMFVTDWRIALVALASLPLTLLVVVGVSKFSGSQFTTYRKQLGILNGKIEENYAGYMIIKLFSKEKDVEESFDESNEKMTKADGMSQFLSGLIFPTTNFINNLAYVGVAVVAGYVSDPGTMISFFLFLNLFTRPFQQLGQIFSIIQSIVASGERIYNLFDEVEEIHDAKDAISNEDQIKGNISFNNVFFEYTNDKPLIENFNLNIKAGDTVAIVGPTGAGKTTIVNLLMRFYEICSVRTYEEIAATEVEIMNEINRLLGVHEVKINDVKIDKSLSINEATHKALLDIQQYYVYETSKTDKKVIDDPVLQAKLNVIVNSLPDRLNNGSISVDGYDSRDYKRNTLRGSIGMVLQDTWLFKGTIKENLLYGDENATDEEIENACRQAHIYHFIQTLPGGYDFVLNEDGTNVSQGQRQLLTIARAIISKPKILILDEATSSVDTRTEQQIQDALNKIMKDRTSFVIAHRLSTIKNAKMIIVMKKGHIVETGNHKELLAKNGFYAELYNSQFAGSNPMAKNKEVEDS